MPQCLKCGAELPVDDEGHATQRNVLIENGVLRGYLQDKLSSSLLGSESIGQRLRRAGGYLAIIGKKGPTFTFDDSVTGDPAMGGISRPAHQCRPRPAPGLGERRPAVGLGRRPLHR